LACPTKGPAKTKKTGKVKGGECRKTEPRPELYRILTEKKTIRRRNEESSKDEGVTSASQQRKVNS